MYKCDKCGCEHNSTTTCPKCGAPVVVINSDYLRRKAEYEEKMKNGGAPLSLEEIYFGKKDASKSDRKSDNPKKDKMRFDFRGLIDFAKEKFSKERHIKADDRKLEFEENDETAMYEKLLLEHVIFKNRMKKVLMITAGVLVVLVVGFFAVRYFVTKDRSNIVYYDGKTVYSGEKQLFDTGLEGRDYTILAHNSTASACFLKNSDMLMARYNNTYVPLPGDAFMLTTQYKLSEDGQYLAYVLYEEASAKYTLILCDLKIGTSAQYENSRFLEINSVTDEGVAVYMAYETMEHSIVVESTLMIATTEKNITVSDGVKDILCPDNDGMLYFIADETLYGMDISKKQIGNYKAFISRDDMTYLCDEVSYLVDTQLGNEILFVDTEGRLKKYADGENAAVASGFSGNETVYIVGECIYFVRVNDVYAVSDGRTGKLFTKPSYADICVFENALYCVDEEENLWALYENGQKIVNNNVTDVINVEGMNAVSYVKDGVQYYTDFSKKDKIVVDKIPQLTCYRTIKSREYLYYVDQNNILWRRLISGDNIESLGYASFVLYVK